MFLAERYSISSQTDNTLDMGNKYRNSKKVSCDKL